MVKTLSRRTNCHNCKFCLAGDRCHGPHDEHWEQVGPNKRAHRYGAAGGGGSAGDDAPLPEGARDEVSDAVIGYYALPPERQAKIEETMSAKGRANRLKRAAVERLVAEFIEREGIKPSKAERKEIGAEVERNADRTLRAALRKARDLSGKLANWRRRERERRERDEEKYEREKRRYEEAAMREIEYEQRKMLFAAVKQCGFMRRDGSEEHRAIPMNYLRKDGLAPDDMADHLKTHYPEFGIEDSRDLIDFLRDSEAA